jgi:hypothetical protein
VDWLKSKSNIKHNIFLSYTTYHELKAYENIFILACEKLIYSKSKMNIFTVGRIKNISIPIFTFTLTIYITLHFLFLLLNVAFVFYVAIQNMN